MISRSAFSKGYSIKKSVRLKNSPIKTAIATTNTIGNIYVTHNNFVGSSFSFSCFQNSVGVKSSSFICVVIFENEKSIPCNFAAKLHFLSNLGKFWFQRNSPKTYKLALTNYHSTIAVLLLAIINFTFSVFFPEVYSEAQTSRRANEQLR